MLESSTPDDFSSYDIGITYVIFNLDLNLTSNADEFRHLLNTETWLFYIHRHFKILPTINKP